MTGRILVGSCSWTDPSLISSGRFYPAGVSTPETRLRYYADQFLIVEVDSTYYSPPSERNSVLWASRTLSPSSSYQPALARSFWPAAGSYAQMVRASPA